MSSTAGSVTTVRLADGLARPGVVVATGALRDLARAAGMSHNYPYTAETVLALCDGHPVYRRTRTVYRDRVSDPTRVTRPNPGGADA